MSTAQPQRGRPMNDRRSDPLDKHVDRPDSGIVRTFERDGDIQVRVDHEDGRVRLWLRAQRDRDGAVTVRELQADRAIAHPRDLQQGLDAIDAERFRFADRRSGVPGRIDLLTDSAEVNDWWQAADRAGPGQHVEQAHRDELRALALHAEARIFAIAGEPTPAIADRAEFLHPDEFDEQLSYDGPGTVLGAYQPDTGRIIIRDDGDLRAHAVLVHEGLHALRHERSDHAMPHQLDEAITEHFTRVADPLAAGPTVDRVDADGTVVYAVPELATPIETDQARFVRREMPYEDRLALVEHIESVVGRSTLWDFYRTGDPHGIWRAYDGRCGAGSWTRLVDRSQRGVWDVPDGWRRSSPTERRS